LIVLEPETIFYIINGALNTKDVNIASTDSLISGVVLGLAVMVLAQFLLNNLYLRLFLYSRKRLIEKIIASPFSSHADYHQHVCLDLIPLGYESVIKLFEIAVFYSSLMLLIFLINPIVAITVVILLFLILIYMLMFVNERSSVRREAYQKRQNLVDTNNLIEGLEFTDHNFLMVRKSNIYSELFGGMGMVFVMLLYVVWLNDTTSLGNNFTALVLVLSIRFIINYTSEFSNLMGTVFGQYTMLGNLDLYNSADVMSEHFNRQVGN